MYQRAYAAGSWPVYTSYHMVLCTIWIIRNVATLGIAWAADARHAILPLSNGILSLYLLSLAFCQRSIQLHHKPTCYMYTPVGAFTILRPPLTSNVNVSVPSVTSPAQNLGSYTDIHLLLAANLMGSWVLCTCTAGLEQAGYAI